MTSPLSTSPASSTNSSRQTSPVMTSDNDQLTKESGARHLSQPTISGALTPESSVVGVVVARDPGDWFDDTLASLAAQDHKAFSLLIIDDASIEPVKSRVANIVPNAFVRRHDTAVGFAAAINDISEMVSGAGFYLLCHDDVALASDAVRLLVAESVRRNAAVVGPKLVSWLDHDRLLAVGLGLDRAGSAIPLVEEHERDQGQHDLAQEVVAASGAALLVRATVFDELRGFDASHTVPVSNDRTDAVDPISLGPDLGEDLDFCWRARIAGHTIAIEPLARVAHLAVVHGSANAATAASDRISVDDTETVPVSSPPASDAGSSSPPASDLSDPPNPDSTEWQSAGSQSPSTNATSRFSKSSANGSRSPANTEKSQTIERRARTFRERNRIRSMLVTSSTPRLPFIVPILVLQTLWRSISTRHRVFGTATGFAPWRGVWQDRSNLRTRRHAVQSTRQVSDRDDLGRLLPIGARARAAFRADVSADSARLWNLAEQSAGNQRASQFRALILFVGLLLWLIGSRSFLNGHIPAAGQFMPIGRWRDLFRVDSDGSIAAPALLFVGALRTVVLSSRVMYAMLTVGMLIVGALNVWRLAGGLFRPEQEARSSRIGRKRATRGPQTAITIAYIVTGVGVSALAEGRLDGIVTFGLYPLVLARMLRSARRLSLGKSSVLNKLALVAPAAASTAILVAFAPGAMFIIVLTIFVLSVVGVPTVRTDYDTETSGPFIERRVLRSLGAVLLFEVALLLLPFTVSLAQGSWRWERLAGGTQGQDATLSFLELIRFGTGRAAPSVLLYGLLIAAVVPLLLGSEFRLRQALFGWTLFLSSVAVLWLSGRGWLASVGQLVPHPVVMLVPAAFGLALAAGIGLTTLTTDVTSQRFGWRQVVGGLATMGFGIGCVPVLTAVATGRWLLPESTARSSLTWMAAGADTANDSTPPTSTPTTGAAASPVGAAAWIGPSGALPIAGWRIDDLKGSAGNNHLAFGLAGRGLPSLSEQWHDRFRVLDGRIARSIAEAKEGSTSRVGKLLPEVRYFVFVDRVGPNSKTIGSVAEMRAAFRRQFDIREVESSLPGTFVFENTAWQPTKNGRAAERPARGTLRLIRTIQLLWWAFIVAILLRSRQRRRNRELALLDQERLLGEEREDTQWSDRRVGDFLQTFDEPDQFDDLGFADEGIRSARRSTVIVRRPARVNERSSTGTQTSGTSLIESKSSAKHDSDDANTGREAGGNTTGREAGGNNTGREAGGNNTGREAGGNNTESPLPQAATIDDAASADELWAAWTQRQKTAKQAMLEGSQSGTETNEPNQRKRRDEYKGNR